MEQKKQWNRFWYVINPIFLVLKSNGCKLIITKLLLNNFDTVSQMLNLIINSHLEKVGDISTVGFHTLCG